MDIGSYTTKMRAFCCYGWWRNRLRFVFEASGPSEVLKSETSASTPLCIDTAICFSKMDNHQSPCWSDPTWKYMIFLHYILWTIPHCLPRGGKTAHYLNRNNAHICNIMMFSSAHTSYSDGMFAFADFTKDLHGWIYIHPFALRCYQA